VKIRYRAETWPVAGVFRISRATMTEAETLLVEIEEEGVTGRGEGNPEARYEESNASCAEQLEVLIPLLERGIDRLSLQRLLPSGSTRNALDCALWDLEARHSGGPAWKAAGIDALRPVTSAYTISMDDVETMAGRAAESRNRPLLKIKLGDAEDLDRVRAVRRAAPDSRLIVDANEAWDFDLLRDLAPCLNELGVGLIEQPLPAGRDEALAGYRSPVPLCADESCRDRSSLADCVGRYDYINIKLDKTGGLTEALRLAHEAQLAGLRLMVGCMLGTSLAMAPAMIVAQLCDFVDLDGPLLLARDRTPRITYENSVMKPQPDLWGLSE
jgi:L-alanine-DL-glutamate epimerase-like enolase superfamily enzyme